MKIGVVSDSHGNLKDLERAILKLQNVDLIFHLGDFSQDGETIKQLVSIPVIVLKGNMDYGSPFGVDYVKTLEGGKNIIACHGHEFSVKSSLNRLFYHGKENGADILLYGHTHCPLIEEMDGIFVMNPGALANGGSFYGKTYGLIEIDGEDIKGEIFTLD